MVIIAKCASTCPACGAKIAEGAKVEWTKGEKAKHVACPAAISRASATKAPTKQRIASLDEVGVSRRSTSRDDRYSIGDALWLKNKNAYYIVVGDCSKWRDDDDDEWHIGAQARPATPDEVAPLLAARAEKDAQIAAQETLRRIANELTRYGEAGDSVPRPIGSANAVRPVGGREILVHRQPMGAVHILVVTDTCVWSLDPGSYDDCREMSGLSTDAALIQQVRCGADLLKK